MADHSKGKSCRFQYSLRTLLVLIAIVCCLLAYIRAQVVAYEADWRKEQAALDAVKRLFAPNGSDVQAYTVVVGPAWLRLLTPADESKVFERVVSVSFFYKFPTNRDDTDALITNLKKLSHLKRIHEWGGGIIVIPSPLESILISLGVASPLPSWVNGERIQLELPNVAFDFSIP